MADCAGGDETDQRPPQALAQVVSTRHRVTGEGQTKLRVSKTNPAPTMLDTFESCRKKKKKTDEGAPFIP